MGERVIYLDVTSSCKSPMNTGVQRVVRSLHRCLRAVAPVTPVVWDPALASYCRLSARERRFLERPFAGRPGAGGGDAEPGRRANPVPVWSKLARRVAHRWNRLDLPARLTAADTLFVPEIFQDNRIGWFAALPRRTAARRVGVCHDAIAVRRPDVTPPARQGGFAEYLDALGTLDHIVAVSRETADELMAFWRERGRVGVPEVSVLPWPVDHGGEARPEITPAGVNGRPTVLCVGTLEPRKNHLILFEASKKTWCKGIHFELVLIGRTTAHWGRRVLEGVDRLQAAGHPVRWLRHVSDDALRDTYRRCSFTVFPSLVEGFGLPILESLWHGRPCVCGTNGAIGEVAAGGGCLPVDQTDASALAVGMERLLTDQALYRRLWAEAAARRFDTWESLAHRLLPILAGTGGGVAVAGAVQ